MFKHTLHMFQMSLCICAVLPEHSHARPESVARLWKNGQSVASSIADQGVVSLISALPRTSMEIDCEIFSTVILLSC